MAAQRAIALMTWLRVIASTVKTKKNTWPYEVSRYKCTVNTHAKPQVTRKWNSRVQTEIHHRTDWNRHDFEFRYGELPHPNYPFIANKYLACEREYRIGVKLRRLQNFPRYRSFHSASDKAVRFSRAEFRPRVHYPPNNYQIIRQISGGRGRASRL